MRMRSLPIERTPGRECALIFFALNFFDPTPSPLERQTFPTLCFFIFSFGQNSSELKLKRFFGPIFGFFRCSVPPLTSQSFHMSFFDVFSTFPRVSWPGWRPESPERRWSGLEVFFFRPENRKNKGKY